MCTKEEQDVMVKAVRKVGVVRSVLTLAALVLTIAATGWTVSRNVRVSVEDNLRETAKTVFVEEHGQAATEVLNAVDSKIQIHSLEEAQKTQAAIGEVQEQVSEINGKLDILIERP